ncbi:ABC transporter permease [Enterococcus sp. AD013-P3]|uniref:ABC transporter permease n=1 Tax=Enterococcus sp. AD013-P3 TaxID=3411036 RepID=UPI003B927413
MKKKKFRWSNFYLAIVFIMLYLPIFYLIFYSFNAGDSMNSFSGFSLQHYQAVFQDTRLIIIVLNTFMLAFLSALLATVIGTFGAMAIYYTKKRRTRTALLSANNILMVSPDVIIGASFLIFFTMVGSVFKSFQLGFTSVLLSHIAFSIPIVVLMVLPKLQEMNDSMVDAARDLGANNLQVLQNIILPFLTPGIIAGYFMAFTYSLDDFAVTFFVTGNGFTTMSVEIYSRARQGISLEINALSTLVFLFSMILVVGYYFISKENRVKKTGRQRRKGLEVPEIR